MSIYNPNIKKSPLAIAPTWAKLASSDGKFVFNFLVNPESIRWQHGASLNSLNVLRSDQPLANYQYSSSTLTIPQFYLWTHNNSATVANEIKALKAMTKPTILGSLPPILMLTWGELKEDRLVLTSVDIEEKQWRSGQPTQAQGSMTFMYSPLAVSPVAAAKSTPKETPRQKANTKAATILAAKAKPKSGLSKLSSAGLIINNYT